ncbi:hypothetical protein JCM6882_006107 [Rhodosporidiobolus microsporus]
MAESVASSDRRSGQALPGRDDHLSDNLKLALHHLDTLAPYDHWGFSEKVHEIYSTNKDTAPEWDKAAALLYRHKLSRGGNLVGCAVTGRANEEKQSAHMIAQRRGDDDFDLLLEAKVVPPFASHVLPSNRFEMVKSLHLSFDHGDFHLVPDVQTVLVRLAAEYIALAQELNRLAGEQGSSKKRPRTSYTRPSFDLFYKGLETEPAVVHLVQSPHSTSPFVSSKSFTSDPALPIEVFSSIRTPKDRELKNFDTYTPFPPLILPVSTNALVYAMAPRIKQFPPAPLEVVRETANLSDLTLLDNTRTLISTRFSSSIYAKFFSNPSSYSFTDLPAPQRPSPAFETGGNSVREAGSEEVVRTDLSREAGSDAAAFVAGSAARLGAGLEAVEKVEKEVELRRWLRGTCQAAGAVSDGACMGDVAVGVTV